MRTIVSVGYGGRHRLTGRGRDAIHLGCQCRPKSMYDLILGQRVAQGVDLLAVVFVGEQVGLDGAARGFIGVGSGRIQNGVKFESRASRGFRSAQIAGAEKGSNRVL